MARRAAASIGTRDPARLSDTPPRTPRVRAPASFKAKFDIGGTTLNWKFVAAAFVLALGAFVVGTLLYVFTTTAAAPH